MIEIPGKIPITIHPFFWVLAALIGWLFSQGSFWGTLIWMGIVLVSVLFHEFGHALAAVCFGQKAKIQLVALGGATSYEGPKLKFWKQFLIVLSGPLFGFFLFVMASGALFLPWAKIPMIYAILKNTAAVNLFWTIINLLPILPMDGGQLLRIFLEGCFGPKGFKASLLIGAILAAAFAFYFFMLQIFIGGALFFLFAFQSFELWRRSRSLTAEDREDDHRNLVLKGEMALREGRIEEAKGHFLEVLRRTKKGVLASTAGQYLAMLYMQQGQKSEAYELLLSFEGDISDEARPLLHQLAAEHGNYEIVAKHAKESYQSMPSKQVALRNARAFAHLNDPKQSGGWLQTALQYEGTNLNQILQEEVFAKVKEDPEFKKFIQT